MVAMGLANKHGEHLLALSRGLDERRVVPHHEPKSIGHETTFEEDVEDPELVKKTLLWLADAVAVRLRKHGVKGQTLTLKFRDERFVTETRSHTFREAVDDAEVLYGEALAQLERIDRRSRKVRLVGLSLSNLKRFEEVRQLPLFERDEKRDKLSKLGRARDALEARFGKGTVERASLLGEKTLHPLAPSGTDES
jgi:DNA polymerase IV